MGGEEGEEVGLQREMGLVSGISLIVGKTFFLLHGLPYANVHLSLYIMNIEKRASSKILFGQEQLWGPAFGKLQGRPCGLQGERTNLSKKFTSIAISWCKCGEIW